VIKMKVSIVVPVYNAEKTLKDCIYSLLKMDYKDYEIIFVDDGSTDSSKKIITDFANKYEHIRLLEQMHRGPASARNLGIRNSSGKIVFFTDSDCIVPINWVKSILEYFGDKSIGAVGGSLTPVSTNSIYEVFDQKRRENLYGTKKKFVDALPTCNLAVRREILEKIGGFDESFKYASAEDYDLCYRIRRFGYKILYVPKISVMHHHPQNFKTILRKGYIHGKEFIKLRRKYEKNLYFDIRMFLNSLVSPFLVVKRYPLNLLPLAFLYETSASIGRIRSLLVNRT